MSDLATTVAFAAGHGGGANWREAMAATLQRLGPVPDGSNLGLVYASDALLDDLDAVVATLRQETGIAHWVGCVGMGVMGLSLPAPSDTAAMGDADEYFAIPALSVLAMRLPADGFRLIPAQPDAEAYFSA